MRTKSTIENYLFVLPAVLIFSIFYIYPFYKVFTLALCQWDGIAQFSFAKSFIGLRNFKELLMQDRVWWQAMTQAGYITLIALTFQNALALALALACDRDIKGANIYRVIFYIPPVLSGVVVGLVWRWIYDGNYGLLNYWLQNIGLSHLITDWLSNPKTALTSVAVIHCWKGFGWGFIIFLAGLQTIPRQLYEAAKVDGANSWQMFKKVTIPLMVPVFILVSILTILGTMQVFVLILSMTGGGPGYHTEVPVTRILASMVGSSRFGYACSQSIIFGAILMAVSFIQIRLSKYMRQA
ncbi:MAG: sugar ABC transporter permease [Candidatus Omnitrophica bacterium]|nr:sugar ABC transporter permease [Candidatus Omnitrophota bacterium]MBU4590702.1 sugar ABC transporter permease [Candidatus Omnitrophota bacterium]